MKLDPKFLLPIGIVVAGVLGAVVMVNARPTVERSEPTPVVPLIRVVEARPQSVRLDVAAQGTAEPHTETDLVAEVAGRIVEVSPAFREGAAFRRGQLLARIDPSDYSTAVTEAEARLEQAKVALTREVAQAEVAATEWAEVGVGEPPPLALREPQLAEARATVKAAEAAVERARLNLRRTEVRAPYTGRVTSSRVDLGSWVGPGTPLGSIYASDYAEVELAVAPQDLAFLAVDLAGEGSDGGEVVVRGTVAGEERAWRGHVTRVGSRIDPKTRMLSLFARVDDPFGRADGSAVLPMGLFVQAEIHGRRVDGVVPLPRSALREDGRVMVVDDDRRLRFRSVDVLRTEGDRVLVSGGLDSGELVCVSPLETAVDGMQVQVTRDDAPTVSGTGTDEAVL